MDKEKIMIMRLQDNLSTIRKLGGWTTQELGNKIGVTKQTISNLENKKSTMTKLQYIGLRSVLDREANSNSEHSKLLKMAMETLLDAELSPEELKEYEEKIELAAAAIAGGATVATVYKTVEIERKPFESLPFSISKTASVAGLVSAVGMGAVTLASGLTAKWLDKLMGDD